MSVEMKAPAAPVQAFEQLRKLFAGALIGPGDGAYDAARAVCNGMIDKHPVLIARCTCVADVVAAVNFAREQQLVAAERGGGHNVAGWEHPEEDQANIDWVRACIGDVERFSDGSRYLNFAGLYEEGDEMMKLGFGPQYARLAQLKAKYDPANLFGLNQNIKPAAGSSQLKAAM